MSEIPFNKLTPAESERLALLIEECGEVIQAASKILRHGYHSYDPTVAPEDRVTNLEQLEKEIGHLDHAIGLMAVEDIRGREYMRHSRSKSRTIAQWLHHQPALSTHETKKPGARG